MEVYAGSPLITTGIFTIMPKLSLLSIIIKISASFVNFSPLLNFLGVLSIIIGCLGAVAQTNIIKVLAYSTITNVGFVLIGIAN